ncbi:MAG: tol-pal system-associated acyl-CoA thioesterase [Azoarcus sp.]|jgi:acyl-CoA thioester hydrolase|nr:tol-pal system-associated acyl-CoA thioesterase [Azoarcus sp.]
MNEPRAGTVLFSLPVRIYYEDTDAAGVVYYANYFRFFERCRTEWMRSLGHDRLSDQEGLVFVVRAASAEYLQPGRLDDEIVITLEIGRLGRSSLTFCQRALRDGETLANGSVEAVCVDVSTMKSTPIPGWLRQALENAPPETRAGEARGPI